MKTVGLAVAACALVALATGCGAGVMSSASATGVSPVAAPTRNGEVPVAIADRPAKFGERRAAGDSLLVTLPAPKSFVPGENAYPRARRAVAFEIAIENQGSRIYRPTQLRVTVVTPDGHTADPVVDKAQGYSGGVSADIEVPSGKSTKLTLAFAMPQDPVDVRVLIQPDVAAAGARAEFEGSA
ncbi:hypothetical protein JOF56_000523 [Kibdelosporangium banguiense]|uniref:DUF4352 domain-containing protein n=1 Tax=Kibdelosporangium banguiense TaxID=1365924 RepID=A0ABS4T8I6_9PSEU|nr:hypothetical protein [Kibdelosporangium banguiense]MBP2320138.1 hypothetical protein [Kibdelosporangium banguiense]